MITKLYLAFVMMFTHFNVCYFLPVVFDLKEGKPVEISDFVPQPAR